MGTLGLVMFLYGLGVQFGRQFFSGLASRQGQRYNLLAGLTLVAAAALTLAEQSLLDASHAMMAGLFAGSGTNAATMQAALEAAGNNEPAIGYSVAYPFGLVGAILAMYVAQLVVRPNTEAASASGLHRQEVSIRAAGVGGARSATRCHCCLRG